MNRLRLKRMIWIFSGTIVLLLMVLGFTNPNQTSWIQWQTQQEMQGYTSGQGMTYEQAMSFATANPYQNDILFSLGEEDYATGQMGYVGVLGRWIEAEGPTTKLLPQGGRVWVKDPYIGFWGWLYKTFHTSR